MVSISDRVLRDDVVAVGESAGPGDIADRYELWDIIVGEYQPRLTAFARARGVSDPDDVAQDVLSVAAEKLDSFTGTWSDFRAWLFTIAYRRVADHYRIANRRRALPRGAVTEPGADLDPASWVSEAETLSEAMAALDVLTDREREVVAMRVFEELSADDVGSKLGLSASHVRVVQARAVAKLRAQLAPRVFDRVRGILAPAAVTWAAGNGRIPAWLRWSGPDRLRAGGVSARIRRAVSGSGPLDGVAEATSHLAAGPALGAVGAVAALVVGVAATFGGTPVLDPDRGGDMPPVSAGAATTASATATVPGGDVVSRGTHAPAATAASPDPAVDLTEEPPVVSSDPVAPPTAPPTAPTDGEPAPSAPTVEENTQVEPPPTTGTVVAGVDITSGPGSASVGAGAGLGAGPAGAAVDADVDLSLDGSSVDASLEAGGDAEVDLGPVGAGAALDAGVEASVTDGGLEVESDAEVDVDAGVGDLSVDLDADVGVGLGEEGVDLGVDLGLGLGLGGLLGRG